STSADTRFARLSLDISSCLSGSTAVSRVRLTSVEDAWSSGSHFFDSFSNCSLKILLGSSNTCIFPFILFTVSFPLMETSQSLLSSKMVTFPGVTSSSENSSPQPVAAISSIGIVSDGASYLT
ncbi:hypothetical protein Tco_1573425, partial [Tanacetum coccineum]